MKLKQMKRIKLLIVAVTRTLRSPLASFIPHSSKIYVDSNLRS